MNTLQDLRSTLDAHAASVHDHAALARSSAVHGRARAIRRRRFAAVAATVAVVALAATTVPLLSRGSAPVPADRQLIGKVAPATLTSLGYTYDFENGVEGGEKHATIRLRASAEPRLVTWASDAADVGILATAGALHLRSSATDFDDFVYVAPGESGRWTIRAGGAAAAIAVYELADEAPEGITVEGITFRQQVGDEELIDAVIGEAGQSDLTFQVALPAGGLRVAELCAGVPDGFVANVEVDQRGVASSGGCGDDTFDPGSGSASWYDAGDLGEPGTVVTVRTWVSRLHDGEPVALDDVRLGLAAYSLAPPVTTVAGWRVPDVVEHDGHRWGFVGSNSSDVGARRLVVRRDWDEPTLLVSHVRGIRQWGGEVMVGDGVTSGGGAFSGVEDVFGPSGGPFVMNVRTGLTDRTALGVSLYQRLD
jgi:hypothetical protein